MRQAWLILAHPDADPAFARLLEATGLAASGERPHAELVSVMVAAWIDWAADRIDGDLAHRRSEAEVTVAIVDGLLLLGRIAGTNAAERIAQRLDLT